MAELIFFGVIIVFTILDSVARTRKAKLAAEAENLDPSVTREPEAWEESIHDRDVPIFDPGPDFSDEQASHVEEPPPRYGSQPDESESVRAESEPFSRGPSSLLPKDLLEELAGLVGGLEDAPAAPAAPPTPEPRPEHRVHLAHADYGTDPSERAPSEQDGLDPLAEHLSADASWVRRQLRSRGIHALRQAVVMQEVLGPPAALVRTDRFER
jgi:hypothetical protein